MHHYQRALLAGAAAMLPAVASAQTAEVDALRRDLSEARSQIERQRAQLDAQEARLRAIETRIASNGPTAGNRYAVADADVPGRTGSVEPVGEAPELRMPEIAVLGDQGNIITRAGQFTAEAQLEYTRADRNRAIFRGIEVVESVLIGVFDINENRQDILTAAANLRYGVTNRFEVGLKLPFVYRSDKSVLAPIAGSTSDDGAQTRDSSARGHGLGDIELSARYQLTSARRGLPFLIGNLQLVVPTGSNPYSVKRDANGLALRAATGSGFWGITPSVTAILPTDPAVLFGTLGYTHNFGRKVDTRVGDVVIRKVKPGDGIQASMGIGISLNQRTSFNLGYAHNWVFGTHSRTDLLDPDSEMMIGTAKSRSRDLQIGRLLFGINYRVSDRSSVNWAVEVGATADAPNLRTVLRIPFVFGG